MKLDQPGFLTWLGENAMGVFVVVVVLCVFVVLLVVIRALWKPLYRTVMTMNAILSLPETLARHEASLGGVTSSVAELAGTVGGMQKDLATVKHEVLPNSGKSLADEVHRQGDRLTGIEKTQRSMQGTVRSQARQLKAISESLEMTQQPEAVKRARARAKLA